MKNLIVTVQREGDGQEVDLELPSDVPSQELSAVIAQALSWQMDAQGCYITYLIYASPPGRLLKSDESLGQAGAWDGAHLVLRDPRAANQNPLTAIQTSAWSRKITSNPAPDPQSWKRIKVGKSQH